jgi:predicted nucleic acid-binding protein
MAWVVDSCILLDIAVEDPDWLVPSARLIDRLAAEGLVVCPVSIVEIAPYFDGDVEKARAFLNQLDIRHDWNWLQEDTGRAAAVWTKHVRLKRAGGAAKRPVADILIGAFAVRVGGLLTRNAKHFRTVFPDLRIMEPEGV